MCSPTNGLPNFQLLLNTVPSLVIGAWKQWANLIFVENNPLIVQTHLRRWRGTERQWWDGLSPPQRSRISADEDCNGMESPRQFSGCVRRQPAAVLSWSLLQHTDNRYLYTKTHSSSLQAINAIFATHTWSKWGVHESWLVLKQHTG